MRSDEDNDEGQGTLILPGETSAALGETEYGLEVDDHQAAEIRQIFGTSFPQYLLPIEEILEKVFSGKGDLESVELLRGMINSLMAASERMGFMSVYEVLGHLRDHVQEIGPFLGAELPRNIRETIVGDLLELKDIAEEMGGEAAPKTKSQTIFSLLADKEGVGDLVLKRLSAAGLITVDQLAMARRDEIAAVTGLDLKIVDTLLSYVRGSSPDPAPAAREAEVPAEIQALHDEVVQKLRAEVEAEAALEEQRAELRRRQSRLSEQRAETQALEGSIAGLRAELGAKERKLTEQAAFLDELRATRDALIKQCASREEELQRKESRLDELREERRRIEGRSAELRKAVDALVLSLGPRRGKRHSDD